jgi:hypothetical protein
LVAARNAADRAQFELFVHLFDYVARGGIAVFLAPPFEMASSPSSYYDIPPEKNYLRRNFAESRLKGPGFRPGFRAANALTATGLFPVKSSLRQARGMWMSVSHYVRSHPVFDGLPAKGLMDQDYANICAQATMMGLPGETVAGSVSWENEAQDYRGPLAFWHGSDVAVVPHGKGKLILSTLELLDHLGKDPVADKLLFNIIRYAEQIAGPVDPLAAAHPEKLRNWLAVYDRSVGYH